MTDLQSGRQTHITDDHLLETVDHICRVFRARQMWSIDHADDVFQEIYIALFKARDRYDSEKGEWINYAFMTAKHAVQDFFRSKQLIGQEWGKRGEPVHFDEIHPDLDPKAHHDGTPLEWELEPYTPKERKIILLTIAGYSQREIADWLGTSEHYLSRIIERLRIQSTPYSSSLPTDSLLLRRAA